MNNTKSYIYILTDDIIMTSSLPQTYAHNVIGRSVHGALLFLERGSFTADQLASILQVPMSKTHHRKLLANKMAALFSEDIDE